MPTSARPLAVWCVVALLAVGCSQTLGGHAVRSLPGIDDASRSPVDVEQLMLAQSQMRAMT
jgi:hypothetical protein